MFLVLVEIELRKLIELLLGSLEGTLEELLDLILSIFPEFSLALEDWVLYWTLSTKLLLLEFFWVMDPTLVDSLAKLKLQVKKIAIENNKATLIYFDFEKLLIFITSLRYLLNYSSNRFMSQIIMIYSFIFVNKKWKLIW